VTGDILRNPLIGCILLLALAVYFLLARALLLIGQTQGPPQPCPRDMLATLVAALPLLGLLGTITGLLDTFAALSEGAVDPSTLLSSGIADALLTTQLGLITAIPGWLLLGWLGHRGNQAEAG
jgi:biopolymer transport protein ExbB